MEGVQDDVGDFAMRIDLTGEVAAAAKSDLSARCVSLDNLLLTREAEGGPSRSHDYPCAKSCPGHRLTAHALHSRTVRQKVTIQYVGKEKRFAGECFFFHAVVFDLRACAYELC